MTKKKFTLFQEGLFVHGTKVDRLEGILTNGLGFNGAPVYDGRITKGVVDFVVTGCRGNANKHASFRTDGSFYGQAGRRQTWNWIDAYLVIDEFKRRRPESVKAILGDGDCEICVWRQGDKYNIQYPDCSSSDLGVENRDDADILGMFSAIVVPDRTISAPKGINLDPETALEQSEIVEKIREVQQRIAPEKRVTVYNFRGKVIYSPERTQTTL